jgi:hypothetical protein
MCGEEWGLQAWARGVFGVGSRRPSWGSWVDDVETSGGDDVGEEWGLHAWGREQARVDVWGGVGFANVGKSREWGVEGVALWGRRGRHRGEEWG